MLKTIRGLVRGSLLIVLLITAVPQAYAWPWVKPAPFPFDTSEFVNPVACQQFGTEAPGSYYCAYFSTPANHDNHDDPVTFSPPSTSSKIELPMVLITATPGALADTALLVAGGGGPGNSLGMGQPDYSFEQMLAGMQLFLDAGVDVVLVDQRGVGVGRPNMNCPQLGAAYRELLAQNTDAIEENQLTEQALSACRQRLQDQHLDIERLDSRDSARDFLSLMEQLPYQRWLVLGVSYGAQLAFEMAAQKPQLVQGLILDSLPSFAAERHFMTEANLHDRIRHIISLCEQDSYCMRQYPGLRLHYLQLKQKYAREPARLAMADGGELILNQQRFLEVLFNAAYWTDSIAYLPYVIHAAAYESNMKPLAWLANDYYRWLVNTNYGDMLHTNIFCEVNYPLQQASLAAEPQQRRSWSQHDEQTWAAAVSLCGMWNVSADNDRYREPNPVSVPSLILSGGLDPITPADEAQMMQDWLPHSRYVLDPNGAHAVLFSSQCMQQQVSQFLRDVSISSREEFVCETESLRFQ